MEENNVKLKKNKSKGIFVFIAIAIVVVVALGGYYFINSRPRTMFDKAINYGIDSFVDSAILDYNTMSDTINMQMKINTENSQYEELVKLINSLRLNMQIDINKNTNQEYANVNVKNDDGDLINLECILDVANKKTYIGIKDWFSKYVEVETSNEAYEELASALEKQESNGAQQKNFKKAMNIVKKDLKKQLEDKYFTSEKVEIQINGKTEKVTKNTMILKTTEIINIAKNLTTKLSADESFLDCWKDEDTVVQGLDDFEEQIENLEMNEDVIVNVSVYTKGLLNKTAKVDIEVIDENKNSVLLAFDKIDDATLSYTMISNNETLLKGNIKIEKIKDTTTVEILADIEKIGEVTVKLSNKIVYDSNFEMKDISSSVKYDELTTEEQNQIYEKFMKSNLYKLITEFSENLMPGLTATDTSGLLESNSIYDTNNEDMTNSTNNASVAENQIKTFDDTVVKFKIPSTFNFEYSSEYSKSFTKNSNETTVQVRTSIQNVEEYMSSIEDKVKYYNDIELYKNVSVSDIKTVTVDGKKYSYRTFTYTILSTLGSEYDTKFEEAYYASNIDNENLYIVEIQNPESMTNEELTQFLTAEY